MRKQMTFIQNEKGKKLLFTKLCYKVKLCVCEHWEDNDLQPFPPSVQTPVEEKEQCLPKRGLALEVIGVDGFNKREKRSEGSLQFTPD
ncbi:hypothetical protein TNIN_364381 [Trichonephila inaurata madagascariensis]|uniref:Uncharacterized protein n=1 Tax=Trichonephila inaurata madagascariensis TaxID=2747483 RepID=A0A8X6X3N8_9ARAC|nr:hypothetical protein TNIN_364381 [Trichonephila inaurata madagascariensis]